MNKDDLGLPPPLALYNARANREGEVAVHSLELEQFFLRTSWEARLRASRRGVGWLAN